MKASDKPRMVVFSYYPLLDPSRYGRGPGDTLELKNEDGHTAFERMLKDVEENLPSGRAGGCIWIMKADAQGKHWPHPVLLMPRAAEIAKHFKAWAEDAILDWFKLYVLWQDTDPKRYGIVVMPNVTMSIQRWRTARVLFHQELPPDVETEQVKYDILFSPIHFGTGGAMAFQGLRDKLPDQMKVYLLDETKLDQTKDPGPQLQALKDEDFLELGEFPLPAAQKGEAALGDAMNGGYLREMLADLTDPAGNPSKQGTNQFRGWVNPDVTV